MHALNIKSLTKNYGNKLALDSVNLTIKEGSIFGLLGPNGAGKSTLINIIADIVKKDEGEINICGYDLDKEKKKAKLKLGVVPQELLLDPFFPVYEALENTAGYYGVPKSKRRTAEIIEAVGLTEKAKTPARRLSGGMRRRLLVAKALVHSPRLLILDEPTAGVDVELRKSLWNYVKELNKQGTTILLTTHYLEEAEELCDQIAVINKGKIIANDSKSNLLKTLDQKKIIITAKDTINIDLDGLDYVVNDNILEITYHANKDSVGDILKKIDSIEIVDISSVEADLEDVFEHLIKSNN